MKLYRAKWTIITKDRPTVFLTERGELTEAFDEAELFADFVEAENRIKELDEPQKFIAVKVKYYVEV